MAAISSPPSAANGIRKPSASSATTSRRTCSFSRRRTPFRNAALTPRPYDPTRAKALLAEAGYPDGFATDVWAIPVTRAYMPNGKRTAELIQANWAQIGVKVNIVTFEWGEFLKRRRAGEADVTMMGGTWDYPDPSELVVWSTCDA